MTTAVLYCRVSTADQVDFGASLASQEAALIAEATQRGWDYVVMREEGKSGKSITGRPVLQDALRLLNARKAQVLMAVRRDRVSRSTIDFATMLKTAQRRGWGIVLSGSKIDTTDPGSVFSSQVQAAAAELERSLISARTREGMAQKKLEGQTFGRVVAADFIPTYRRVLAMHAEPMSMNKIAATLNAENVPTALGGKWYASTVQKMLTSQTAATLTA